MVDSAKRVISNKKWREANRERLRLLRRDNYLKNKDRDLAKSRIYYKTNKEDYKSKRLKNKEHIRDIKFKKYYGISLDKYNEMFVRQGGVCAICKNVETMIDKRNDLPRALAVDHCHKTGKVRGLLCRKCNNGLGIFGENINLLERAIKYISKHE